MFKLTLNKISLKFCGKKHCTQLPETLGVTENSTIASRLHVLVSEWLKHQLSDVYPLEKYEVHPVYSVISNSFHYWLESHIQYSRNTKTSSTHQKSNFEGIPHKQAVNGNHMILQIHTEPGIQN